MKKLLLVLIFSFLFSTPVVAGAQEFQHSCTPAAGGKFLCNPLPNDPACTAIDAANSLCDSVPSGYSTAIDNGDGTASIPKECHQTSVKNEYVCSPPPAGCTPGPDATLGVCNAVPDGYKDVTPPPAPTQTTSNQAAQTQQNNPCTDAGGGLLGYCPLEPLPGLENVQNLNFAQFMGAIFKLLITAGALLAVATLVYAGISYILSEAFETKGEAKKRMQAAMWGLIILLGAWLMLYTINPALLNFNLSSIGTGTGNTSTNNPAQQAARQSFSAEDARNCAGTYYQQADGTYKCVAR